MLPGTHSDVEGLSDYSCLIYYVFVMIIVFRAGGGIQGLAYARRVLSTKLHHQLRLD
jgi:hypothetical protein